MNWDLMWAVVAIAVVARLSYGAGHWTGFKAGVVAMRTEVIRLAHEEMAKMEEAKDEREETP